MTGTSASNSSAEHEAIMEGLRADQDWLAGQGIHRSQLRPDPDAGKVKLANFSQAAQQLLAERKLSRDIRNCPGAVLRTARWWPPDLPSGGHQTGWG
jgi:hypothetical protein